MTYVCACAVRKGIFKKCLLRCVELIIGSFLGNYSKSKKLRFKYSVEFCYFKLKIVQVQSCSLPFIIFPRVLEEYKQTFQKCYVVFIKHFQLPLFYLPQISVLIFTTQQPHMSKKKPFLEITNVGRFHLFIGHEGPQGEQRYNSTLFQTSALED